MARKNRVFTQKMRTKLLVTFLIMMGLFIGVMGRLTYINVKSGKTYEKQVLAQQRYDSKVLPFKRGDILDRKGTPLATSEKVYNLILEPKNILEKEAKQKATIDALAKYFDITKNKLNEIINNNPKSFYQIVMKKLTYEEVQPFKEMLKTEAGKNIVGVVFEEEYKRTYPNKSLASHLIGFTSSGNVGNWGIEQSYNSILNGTNGREYGYLTDELELERTTKPAINGKNVVSTIDINIQTKVEAAIKDYTKKIGGKQVSVLIMDPNNAEVLAVANSYPYDLNNPRSKKVLKNQYTSKEIKAMSDQELSDAYNRLWTNWAFNFAFEPGSTFKPFTIAAGLEEDIIKESDTYLCDGYQIVGGVRINCNKLSGHGIVTVSQSLELSCNDALMQIGAKIGKSVFTKYHREFGFGAKVGLDIIEEGQTEGLIFTEENIKPIDLQISAFGQSFKSTMIQLGTGMCSLINGGYYYQPHVVKQVLDDNGGIVKNVDKILVKNTVSKSTSDKIKKYMYETVNSGTGKGAQVEGYAIGGKTGTAQKLPRGNGKYLISFIGFAPIEKPEFLIYVAIDEPNVEPQSQSKYAVELAQVIMKDLVVYMNIPQTNVKKNKEKETAPIKIEAQ